MEFLYSMRGLPQQLWVDNAALLAVWGKLELAFGGSPPSGCPSSLGRLSPLPHPYPLFLLPSFPHHGTVLADFSTH